MSIHDASHFQTLSGSLVSSFSLGKLRLLHPLSLPGGLASLEGHLPLSLSPHITCAYDQTMKDAGPVMAELEKNAGAYPPERT